MQGPAKSPDPAKRPTARVGIRGRFFPQSIDVGLPEYAPFGRPVKQLAVPPDLVVPHHLETVPGDGTDEFEAEEFWQITLKFVFEG